MKRNAIMKKSIRFLLIMVIASACTHQNDKRADWLIDNSGFTSVFRENADDITLSNGLVSRTISLKPDGATTGFSNLMTGKELIRAIKPEAVLTINGKKVNVGGLTGQPVKNYLAEDWIAGLKSDTASPFILKEYVKGKTEARFEWKKRLEWMPKDLPWPPPGIKADFTYQARPGYPEFEGITVIVHYEIYDGIPLICKWFTVKKASESDVLLDT